MQETEIKPPGILDRAFISFLRLDGEKIAWIVLVLIALLSRTIMLGARAMSHDESLHTVYSFQLFDGRGYQHQPMMHGPLKFILNPLMYFMFGVNDWSARIQVAVFGVVMVAVVWVMRRWLGRTGALLTAVMYTVSPALLYHSRYIRDEVMLTSLLVIMVICLFRYLEERSLPWLVASAVTLGFSFLTMEASFIFGGIFGGFLVLAFAAQLWASAWPGDNGESRRASFRMLAGLALPLLVIGLVLEIFKMRVPGFILLGIGALLAVLAALLVLTQWRWSLRAFRELDLIVLLFTLVMPFLSAVILKALGWEISQFNNPGQISLSMVWQGLLVLAVLFVLSGLLGYLWLRERWFVAAGVFWAIEILFFTTFLTNGQGVGTGLIGSLGYWIDQQEVMRGGQPWYYFYLIVPLYEFLPWILSGIGTVAAIVWLAGRARGRAPATEVITTSAPEAEMPAMGAQRVPLARPAIAPITVQELFVAFLVFWPTLTWLVFTYVGEKMPWHTVYMATSMAPLAGWWLGRVIDGIDWRGKVNSLAAIMLMVPLFLVALKAILPTSTDRPFSNVSVDGLSNTAQWLLGLLLALVLIYFLYDRFVAVGGAQAVRAVVVSLAALLLVFTAGISYRLNFVNFDYATEPIVYAHATPDIKLALSQLEELSRKTAGDHAIRFAYDDDSTWPLEWYFRDYPNKVYFGASPSRDATDSPVVIVGDKNVSKVKPYLGDRYHEFNYRLIWWPRETYKNLNWQRIRDGLRDPVQRGQFWDVVLHRRYTTKTAQWDPIHRFSMFVRKDVAAQVWNWGAAQGGTGGEGAAVTTDPYAGGQRDIAALQQLGVTGQPGTGPGQFNFPRAVAVDGDGNIYVADSGNNRVVVFDPGGGFIREWGSTCKLDTGEGCANGGAAQFNEPWGIAVGADGSVYVSDTWNHRVQKFTNDGQFVTSWGTFGSTGGELLQENLFYGPRAVAVGVDGNVSVMDTGNKRVQVFTPDGQFVTQWGGGGVVEGRFDEPVGLAQDADGRWFVADTWNKRIQRFSPAFEYEANWAVNGWGSQSVVNKPSIAVDTARNTLYAVDPENFRVLAWDLSGQFKASWGLYGNDQQSFTLPTGIAVGPDGRVYVADGDSHRVMVFPPLE
jgi:uncharacterized protein (TIGR03663 family)